MKLKHWQGYGSVEATKISQTRMDLDDYQYNYEGKRNSGNGQWKYLKSYDAQLSKLVIRVSGNHEYGVITDDIYRLYEWLVTRFDKKVRDYDDVLGFEYQSGYDKNDEGLSEEYCEYTIIVEEK